MKNEEAARTGVETYTAISRHCAIPAQIRSNPRINRTRSKSTYCGFAQNYAVPVSDFVRNESLHPPTASRLFLNFRTDCPTSEQVLLAPSLTKGAVRY